MGGEYLPPYQPGKVEIVRIELKSTTADVISVRARPEGGKIAYSISDEYQSEFEVSPPLTDEPLTLNELVSMVDNGGEDEFLGIVHTAANYNSTNQTTEDLESLKDVTEVDSDFYPQLAGHYRALTELWYAKEKQRLCEKGASKG